MKLAEAFAILRRPAPAQADTFHVSLCTSFTPLHLQTFFGAHLRLALNLRPVEVSIGLFGDLAGNIETAAASPAAALAVVMEWADLDPRLGVRRLGGWSRSTVDDILEGCRQSLARLARSLQAVSAAKPVALVLPTLPLPMIAIVPGWEESGLRLQLDGLLNQFALQAIQGRLLRLVSSSAIDMRSPADARFDFHSELNAGYPYRNAHADVLAELLARQLAPPAVKKGLITDLDNTLWSGILGEDGVDGVTWDLEHHSQVHGLYQQLLDSLGEAGTLVGVASKNEPAIVEQALGRADIMLPKQCIFPVAAGWGAKSDAIREILKLWNIGQDAVVFVDDSPLELAEVKAAFPEIECLQFNNGDAASVWALLGRLRDLFGKHQVSAEDAIRTESLRNSAEFTMSQGALGSPEEFLESIEPVVEFSFRTDPPDPRAFELLNKTNQFNLNGYRFTEADWQAYLREPDTFVVTVAYRDKFGPLGKIAVATGKANDGTIKLDRWVMSCRAFSRRIEHCSLQQLFDRFGAREIAFDFAATSKNAPLQQFFKDLTGDDPKPMYRLTRERFEERRPKLSHRIEEN